MRTTKFGYGTAAIAVLLGCGDGDGGRSGNEALGQARVAIQEAPGDVRCVAIAAHGNAVITRSFDIAAGESSVFALGGLPLGEVVFSGEAFPVACAELAADAAPHWLAEPVTRTLEPGVVADVTLTMRRNGHAAVAVDFEDASAAQGGQPASGGSPSGVPLLFSEYVEGSSTYKALEITALADVSLEGCRLAVYFNGGTTPSGGALTGTLLAGESHVLCSSALAGVIGSCDQTVGLTFNGDDALALECDGAIVDVIGQIGFDPGTAWGSGELSLVDHTLRRSCAVTQGDSDASDAFEPSGEWLGFAQDSFDDLGLWGCN